MDETGTPTSGHPTVAAAVGLAFGLLGAALLLQELGLGLGLLTMTWSVVVPLVMLAAGVLLLVSGLVGSRRTSHP